MCVLDFISIIAKIIISSIGKVNPTAFRKVPFATSCLAGMLKEDISYE